MTHKFIVNDENIVNEYGYRVMTAGIDTKQFERNGIVLYMHNRAFDDPQHVVGRVIALEKQGGLLIAEVEFDEQDDYAKKLAGKVERGFIKMASLYADVLETSTDLSDVLPGQIFETVTKCKMVELSIVDIGGNDNAVKLSRKGERIKLKKLTKPETQTDMSIKTIALALGMSSDAGEELVNQEVAKIKLAKENAEARVKTLEGEIKLAQEKEAKELVARAAKLNLIPEGLITTTEKSFEGNFEDQKVMLTKLIETYEAEADQEGKQNGLREVILGGKGSKGKGSGEKKTYDYLQKHDPVELRRIHKEDNAEYVRLAKEYAKGVRHKED